MTCSHLVSSLPTPAPTNDAFDDLPDDLVDFLLSDEGLDDLEDILLYHVVDGKYPSKSLSSGEVETMRRWCGHLAKFVRRKWRGDPGLCD